MARRIPKPFVVEIRNSGRRRAPIPVQAEQEQPRVAWPAAMIEELRVEPEPQKPSGRVLPALDVLPNAPPLLIQVQLEPAPDPVIEILEPAAKPVALVDLSEAIPLTPTLRKQRQRRPRTDFKREERWKARLPTVVH